MGDPRIEDAHDAWGAGDVAGAVEIARKVLAASPDEVDALKILAAAALEAGNLGEATKRLEHALRLSPEDPEALCLWGDVRIETLDIAEARGAYQRAAQIDPEFADAHDGLGVAQEALGDVGDADRSFARATELDPERFPGAFRVTEKRFQQLVEAAIGELPDDFRSKLNNLVILVEPRPKLEMLRGDPPLPPTVLGLQSGTAVPDQGPAARSGDLPCTIRLFQRNIERAATSAHQLDEQISITLMHEIGHFLGLDEDEVSERGLE